MNKALLVSCVLFLSGCQCFKVCPDAPKPPVMTPLHEPCYKHIRDTDPVQDILKCYLTDIVLFEKEVKERETALQPYKTR